MINKYTVFAGLLISSITIGMGIMMQQGCLAKDHKTVKTFVLNSAQDALNLFPKTVAEIEQLTTAAIAYAKQKIDALIAIPTEQKTFANTVKAFDTVATFSDFARAANTTQIIEMVHPDKDIRDAAHNAFIKLQQEYVDLITDNVELYQALKSYYHNTKEQLTTEQTYFITETLNDYKRGGLDLKKEQRNKVKVLKKEIAQLSSEFDQNIAADQSNITVSKEALEGLDEAFIAGLKQTKDAKYILGVDTPTVFKVIKHCAVEQTRKDLSTAFKQRALEKNKPLLESIIAKRHELAQLLGFKTYAHLDIDDQMVKTPERAHAFIQDLISKVTVKTAKELADIAQHLPASVALTKDGKLKPWDIAFVKEHYKQKVHNLDSNKVSEYFPMQKTIDGLFSIYEQFFNLEFKTVLVADAWHKEVQALEVYSKDNTSNPLGYLLLDLHPRPFKYGHACQAGVVPATYYADGSPNHAVAVVIANFPKPTKEKPSLLTFIDVTTFFHEFGHALHTLFGRTKLASTAGTHVKRDFVEMPSQMLEEWMYDADMLKLVSSHYQTGEKLSDELINGIATTKNLTAGMFIERQSWLALSALNYFGKPTKGSLQNIFKSAFEQAVTHAVFDEDDHMYASFGHLTGYGAKYYGYLWSKVFALDLFAEIKKHGLLNPVIGKKYVDLVIGKGGSKDPNELLKDFLGREPNNKAFLKDMGLVLQ